MLIRNTLNGRTITRYNDNDAKKAQSIIIKQKKQVDEKLQDRDNQLKTLIAKLDIIDDIDRYDETRKEQIFPNCLISHVIFKLIVHILCV